MSNKTLAPVNTDKVIGNFTQTELDTLKATIARGTTNEQFALFVQTCVSAGLNPFLNQVYCIVYDGKHGPVMSIQIAVEGIMAIARRHEDYEGFIADVVKENDEFEADVPNAKVTHNVKSMVRGKTLGAYCIAKRKGYPDILTIVTRDEVEHMTRGRNAAMWKDWFDDMLKKHTIKRAFKLQYGIEIAEDEPVGGAGIDNTPSYEGPRKTIDITPSEPTTMQVDEGERIDVEQELAKKWDEVKQKLSDLGHESKEQQLEYIQRKTGKKAKDMKLADLVGLSKLIDMDLKKKEQEAPAYVNGAAAEENMEITFEM